MGVFRVLSEDLDYLLKIQIPDSYPRSADCNFPQWFL